MSKPIQTLNEEESEILIRCCLEQHCGPVSQLQSKRNMLLFLLMLDAGLRVGEVCKLKISDLIFNSVPVRNLTIRKEISKRHTERSIPVSMRLSAAISIWANDLFLPEDYLKENFAFKGYGILGNITPRQVQRIIGSLGKKGIGRKIHPHILRHTFATRLMRVTSSRIVQQLLGHANLQTTQIYTHPNSEDLTKAIDNM